MTIQDFQNNLRGISIEFLMEKLSEDQQFLDYIIQLNTESQLYDRGVNSEGVRLSEIGGGYTSFTMALKEKKGQPIDRVTLRDTGDFYNSWIVYLNDDYDFQIYADPIKDGTNLFTRWGKDIVGLTDTNLSLVVKMAREKIIAIVKQELLNAA